MAASNGDGQLFNLSSLGPNDVLLGRGSGVQYRPGNVAFRHHVQTRKTEYIQTKSIILKTEIAKEIVDHIKRKVDPPGKFLRQSGDGTWEEADDDTALEKVKQALRQQKKKSGNAGGAASDGKKGAAAQIQSKKTPTIEKERAPSAKPMASKIPSEAWSEEGNFGLNRSAEKIEGDLRLMKVDVEVLPDAPQDRSAVQTQANNAAADEIASGNSQIGYFDRLRLAQNNDGSNGTGRLLLATPEDQKFLSAKLCFVRSLIEVFEATEQDTEIRHRKGGRKERIAVGQVGLRCIHCTHVPPEDRTIGTVLYPKSIRLVHQTVRNWQRYHFGNCENMPPGLFEQLEKYKSSRSHSGAASLQYWVKSCKSLGMVDANIGNGVRLKRSPDDGVTPMEGPATVGSMGPSSTSSPYVELETALTSNQLPDNHEALSEDTGLLLEEGASIPGQPGGSSDDIEMDLVLSALSETPAKAASPPLMPPLPDHSRKINLNEEAQDERQSMLDRVQLAYDIVISTHQIREVPSVRASSGASDGHSGSLQSKKDLFSLGVGLYEWFTGIHPLEGNGNNSDSCEGTPSADTDTDAPRKKRGTTTGNKAYTPLRELGFPVSLCSLVSRLLESDNADYYESADEVEEDMRLMIADPDRFLFDAKLEMACGKLEIPHDRLYGRENAMTMLLDAYDRAIESNEACEVVMVTGHSGTGKSSLVHLVKGLLEERGGYFTSGKFDKLRQVQPLSAIVAAFNEYCDILLTRDDKVVDETRVAIQRAIGSDGKALTDLIPNLERIIGQQPELVAVGGKEAGNRFTFLFRLFVRAIASSCHPLVLFLDDLQWADEASLELITSLLTDPGMSSLLFLGCYRDNEVDDDHPLTSQLRCITSSGITVSPIKIGNIDRDSVNGLVSDTLSLLPRVTAPLADIVFSKTSGNGLFVVQFLKSLCDENLLRFSPSSRRWEWDLEIIQSKAIADNVAELMTSKMQKLSPEVQWSLKVAACLGSQNEVLTLKVLDSDGESSLLRCLDVSVSEGLLFKTGSAYKFSHDQIQQAAYSLIPASEHEVWHLYVGRLLWKNAIDEELDQIIFSVVDQLRRGAGLISDRDEKVKFAHLCLMAGEKAMAKSAFLPASTYLLQGTALLEESDWENHYDLTLGLFSCCVEAQYVTGNYDGVTITSNPILARGRCLQDKLRAYYALLDSLGSQGKQLDAIKFGLEVLVKLGESFPSEIERNDVLKDFAKTQTVLEGTSTSDILQMKSTDDVTTVAVIKILNILSRYTYQVNQQLLSLMAFRMVQISLCHGLCRASSFAFAMFGVVLCGFGDLDEGYRYGKLALSLLERFKAKDYVARVYAVVYGLINISKDPMQACLPSFQQGYEVGMSTGDIEMALTNANAYVLHAFQSGCNLEALSITARTYIQLMKVYKHHLQTMTSPCYQTILNLMGNSEEPTVLSGEAMSQDVLLETALEKGLIFVARVYFFRIWLAYYFRRYDVAAEMVERRREISKEFPPRPDTVFNEVFYTGLIATVMARNGEQNEWGSTALEAVEKMKTWAEKSAWNFQHKLDLLNAEIAYLNRDLEGAAKAYDDSIDNARSHRFVNEEALACERAGIFHSSVGNAERAAAYYAQAHKCYLEWGATRKAAHLVELGDVNAD